MLFYPARLRKDTDGTYLVTFRDIPEAVTSGGTREEALTMARDALRTASEFYLEDFCDFPEPSNARRGEVQIGMAPLPTLKILVMAVLLRTKISRKELIVRMTPRGHRMRKETHYLKSLSLAEAHRALAVLGYKTHVKVVRL